MKRGGRLKRRTRLRSKRTKPGVTGRHSLDRAAWRMLKAELWVRSQGRCEVPDCRVATLLDPHHIVKRSQGGADTLDNLVALCRAHHQQTDAAYADGRLIVTSVPGPHGAERRFQVRYAP